MKKKHLKILLCIFSSLNFTLKAQIDSLSVKDRSFDYLDSYDWINNQHTFSSTFFNLLTFEYETGILSIDPQSGFYSQLCLLETFNQHKNARIFWHQKLNQKIYAVGTLENDTGLSSIMLLTADTIGCQSNVCKVLTPPYSFYIQQVIHADQAIYILANFYDELLMDDAMAILCLDLSGQIIWSKSFGVNQIPEYGQSMVYQNNTLFLSGTCFPNGFPFGRGLLAKIDALNGAVKNSMQFELINDQPYSLRINKSFLTYWNQRLILCAQGVAGGNDPVDYILTEIDTALLIPNTNRLRAYVGNQDVRGLSSNNKQLYSFSVGNINSGVDGFILNQWDSLLNPQRSLITQNINLFSLAAGAYMFSHEDHVFYFAKSGFGENEIYYFSTDSSLSNTGCLLQTQNDSSFIVLDTAWYTLSSDTLTLNSYTINHNMYSQSLDQENICLPVSIPKVHESVLNIHPNPTNGIVLMERAEISPVEIEVFSLNGQKVAHFQNMTHQFSCQHLPAGIYIVKIMGQKDSRLFKMIKL